MLRAICSVTALVLLFSLTATGQRLRVESFEGREVVSGEVLVRFRDAGAPQAVALAAQDTDVVSAEQVGRAGVVRLRSRGRNVSALLRAYRQRFDVLYAEPNYIWRAMDFPNDEFASRQWALRNTGQEIEDQVGTVGADIGAVPAWSITEGSRSIVVGVVDSGIAYNHPDLAANVWSAPAPFSVTIGGKVVACPAGSHGFNAIDRTCDPWDDDGHGTHVAGVIGAAGNNGLGVSGISRVASIMALKFLGADGVGTTADAIAAIEFAIQVKAIFPEAANIRVLNNSWGGGSFSQALRDAVILSDANNILFVAAAGNGAGGFGVNNDLVPDYPSNLAVPNVVSVAATNNQDALWPSSNWGPTKVHLGAPGVSILSTMPFGPFEFKTGTSMAAPMVSGAAALILSSCPLTTVALKANLLATVDPAVPLTGKTVSGGRLNVFRALSSCVGTPNGFELSLSPGTQQLELTEPSSFMVTVAGLNGFNGPVNLSLFDVPGNLAATLSSTSILGGSGSSTLVVTPGVAAEAGTYLIGVRATGAGLTRVSGVVVTVGFPIQLAETISGELTPHDAPSRETPSKYGDLYRFTLTVETAITIDLKSRAFDALLNLRSTVGETLFTDNDSGGHQNSRIEAVLAAGTYSVEVTSDELSATGLYTLSINTPTLKDLLAYVGTPGSTVNVTLTGGRFLSPLTIDAGSGISVSNVNVMDSTLASAALTIASDAATTPRNLTVRTAEGVSNPLTFTVAPSIALGERVSGTLSPTDHNLVNRAPNRYVDIYSFTLSSPTLVRIDLSSSAIDSYVFLISATGAVLFEDDDSGFGLSSRITATLAAGTYFIEVTSHDRRETGIYSLSVNLPATESISPAILALGNSNVLVTFTGNSLSAPVTIDAGNGVTVSSVSVVNATTVTARFAVSSGAAVGPRVVTVTTPDGMSNSVTLNIVPTLTNLVVPTTSMGTLSEGDAESIAISGSRSDFYRISMAASTPSLMGINLQTNGFEGYLALLSSTGNVLALGTQSEATGTVQISEFFPPGTYFVEVTSEAPRSEGSYTLWLDAGIITAMTPAFASPGSSVTVFFSGRFPASPVTIDAGPGINVMDLQTTTTGVGTAQGTALFLVSPTADLGLRKIKFVTLAGTDLRSFAVLAPFVPVSVGQATTGALSSADQPSITRPGSYADFYSLTVTGTGAAIEFSSGFEVSIRELNLSGAVIKESNGKQGRLRNLGAGTHIIEVSSVISSIGAYTLSVLGAPTLTSITPNVGVQGTTFAVALSGTNFSSPMTVSADFPTYMNFSNVTVYGPTLATAIVTIVRTETFVFPGGGTVVINPVGPKNITVATDAGSSSSVVLTVAASGSDPVVSSRLTFARFFSSDLAGLGIAILNPGSASADVRFSIYNMSGALVGYYPETIGARTQMAILGSSLVPEASQPVRIEVTSEIPGLQGFWLGGDFANVMDGTESSPSARELIFPLVTSTTELTLTSLQSNTVTLRIYDGGGGELSSPVSMSIPSNGGFQLVLGQLFPSANLNNARYMRVTGGSDFMGTTVSKDFPVSPSWVVLNGRDSAVFSTEANFPHVPSGGGWVSVAGITNLSTSPQAVTFTYYPNSGSSVSVIRNLAGRGSIRESADELFGFAGSTRDGWVKVTGTLPLTGFIVYGYGPTGGSAAVPVQDTPRTSMIFSHVATGPQFETGLAVLNTTSRDANVEVYIMRRTGALVGGAADVLTASFTLRAGTKVARLLSEFVPASVNDDGFVFVRSTNDVPLYAFELFFTRDVKVIANVPAGILPAGVSYSPPLPSNPLPPLSISSLNPATAPVGTVITINGSGFDLNAANTVVFTTAASAVSVPAISATSTTLTVAIPATAVTGPVFFTTGGRFSNSVTLTVP